MNKKKFSSSTSPIPMMKLSIVPNLEPPRALPLEIKLSSTPISNTSSPPKATPTTPFFLSKDLDYFCKVCRHHHPQENCLVTCFIEGRRRVMPPPTNFCETYRVKGSQTTYEVSSKEKIDNWKVKRADTFQSTTVNAISQTSLTIKRFERKSYINPWSTAPWDNDTYLSTTINTIKFNNTNRPALDKLTSTYVSREETFE